MINPTAVLSPLLSSIVLCFAIHVAFTDAFATAPVSPSPYTNYFSKQRRQRQQLQRKQKKALIIRYDYTDDTSPSDYDTSDLPPDIKVVAVDDKEEDVVIRDALKRELLLLASITDRGSFATKEEQDIVIDIVAQLEALNPTRDPAYACEGVWDLCYDSTSQLFRSSPFFQSIRAVVGGSNKDVTENAFALHDQATKSSRIGKVRQIIDYDKLVSEVDLEVGAAPGFPFSISGTVVTTASFNVVSDNRWDLKIMNTKVKRSNIPIINSFMDNLNVDIPVGELYTTLLSNNPVIPMTTFYVDEALRITRDVDENFFVFIRES